MIMIMIIIIHLISGNKNKRESIKIYQKKLEISSCVSGKGISLLGSRQINRIYFKSFVKCARTSQSETYLLFAHPLPF